MAFPKYTIIAVIAASVSLLNVDAFALLPGARQCQVPSSLSKPKLECRFSSLSVSTSPVDSIVVADDDDEPEPEDFIVAAGELDSLDAPAEGQEPSDRFMHQSRLAETRSKFAIHDKDTGSPEFQVAGMTERISYLTSHLKTNPKDFSTRRGLVALVNKRRRLLNFLFREDATRYAAIIAALGIRHKAPGRVESREEKYAAFPKQKSKRN